LCGHFYLEAVACARRDPESKGTVEAKVRYVKRNALQGRDEELTCWEDYGRLAVYWRDEVANVRLHQTHVRVIYRGEEVACHTRCYDRRQLIRDPKHYLEALQQRRRIRAQHVEKSFDALGEQAQRFHLSLRRQPIKTLVHLRRLLNLVRLYGRQDVVAAISRANEYQTYDAAYVETILLQERRRRELPSPTPLRPQREELIDQIELDEPDPGAYDRFCDQNEDQKNDEEKQDE
jgi:hypothetical protein